jgi:hypothetical protein
MIIVLSDSGSKPVLSGHLIDLVSNFALTSSFPSIWHLIDTLSLSCIEAFSHSGQTAIQGFGWKKFKI